MYKHGNFGIYKGIEYQTTSDKNRNYFIFTSDKTKIDDTFCDEDGDGIFIKEIKKEELEEYFQISSYVVIDKQDFLIVRENTEYYWLGTSNKEKAKKYGFKMVDRGCYEKKVRKETAEVRERRKEL